MKTREEVWAVFPEAWRVPQLLCLMFCNITKTQLAEILDSKVQPLEPVTSYLFLMTALLSLRLRES